MIDILARLLSWLMRPCYSLTHHYVFALLLFTVLTRVILLPVNIWVQKNGIKLVKMMPAVNRLKIDHYGDKDAIADGQSALWKQEHYSPILDLVPLVIQLVLLAGVIGVVREPELSGMVPADMTCWGIDFYRIPAEEGGAYLLFPVLAGLAALAMCVTQNLSQVLQSEQSKWNKYGLTILSVGISVYLGLYVRAGVALYWIMGNLIAIAQMYLLNWWFDPKKAVDYDALEATRRELAELNKLGGTVTGEQKKREKADYRRFFSIANKHLVFYSEQSGFYKYFSSVIDYLLAHSNVVIHYITSDPNDQIFGIARGNSRIQPYYIGEKRLITLMMKMDADIVVMTVPDLETYHIKRSLVRDDVEYVYIDHGLSSLNLLLREGAVDHFDTIFCAGDHIEQEMRARENLLHLKPKTMVPYGYGLLQEMMDAYAALPPLEDGKTRVTIAPSHQEGNILDSCLDTLMEQFLERKYEVTIRPHPQYIRRYPARMEAIRAKWGGQAGVTLEENFAGVTSLLTADVLVTDWSNVGYEYAYATGRPVLFLNTPMKVINPNYEAIGVEPIDFVLRRELGAQLELADVPSASDTVEHLLAEREVWAERIAESLKKHVYTVRDSGAVGGAYLLRSLMEKQNRKKEQ